MIGYSDEDYYSVLAPPKSVRAKRDKRILRGEKKYYVAYGWDLKFFDSIVDARKFAYKVVDDGIVMAYVKLTGSDKIVGIIEHATHYGIKSKKLWTIVYKDKSNGAEYLLSKNGTISDGVIYKRR